MLPSTKIEIDLVAEVEFQHGAVAVTRRAHSIGIAVQQIAGELTDPLMALEDFPLSRPSCRKLQHIAVIAETDVEVVLVEGGLDFDRALKLAIIGNDLDRLVAAVNRAVDHVATGGPYPAVLFEKGAPHLRRLGLGDHGGDWHRLHDEPEQRLAYAPDGQRHGGE